MSMQRRGGGVSGYSGVSIWGEHNKDGYVDSGVVAPLSKGGVVILASLLATSVGSRSWV